MKIRLVEENARMGSKPGRKNTWKDKSKKYVRLFTQLTEEDRDILKSSVHGGSLKTKYESVDHFVNEAIINLMETNGLK